MSLKTNLFRFIFISVLGVLLHFTYEWSGDNAVVGLFSAVNESTWEHLKLLFFPFLLLTIDESRSRCPAVAYGCIFRVHLLPAGYWIVLGSYSRPLMV